MKSLSVFLTLVAGAAFGDCTADVSLHSGAGWTVFEAEVSATDEKRAQGLMDRQNLSQDEGMVFLYPKAAPRSFWMKNTDLPLDILFFDDKLKLVSVHKNAQIQSETPIEGGDGISAVLEINGGLFDDLGFGANTKMRVQSIDGPDCPAWVHEGQPFSPKNNG